MIIGCHTIIFSSHNLEKRKTFVMLNFSYCNEECSPKSLKELSGQIFN